MDKESFGNTIHHNVIENIPDPSEALHIEEGALRIIHYTLINQSALIDNESSCHSVVCSMALLVFFVKMDWI